MPLFWATHNKLEQGEFRLDAIPSEVEPGKTYPDEDIILLFRGWLHNWADQWMATGIVHSLLNRTNDEGNLMISFNHRDYESTHEVIPD